jgi:hypothetical protein
MRLTSDYRRVTALFDTPMGKEIAYTEDILNVTTISRFVVGPFKYSVSFYPESEGRGSRPTLTTRVEFQLVDIDATGEELVKLMSKTEQGKIEEQPMSLEIASDIKRRISRSHRYDELAITGPYVLRIFGNVLNIVKDYMKKNRFKVNCLSFSADSSERVRIYQRMAKSAFPGAGIKTGPSPWGEGTEIKVCLV